MSDNTTVATLHPPLIKELTYKLFAASTIHDGYGDYLEYTRNWIYGAADRHYEALIKRDGIPRDQTVLKLLCELAVVRALAEWYEVREQTPPMPSIKQL